MTLTIEPRKRRTATSRAVPKALIYEMWDGKPIYYKGYRDVLAGTKTHTEIMSCSDLQGVLVSILHGYLFNLIDRKKYLIATNETGLHIATGNNLGNDIQIFDRSHVGKLKGKFFDVAPRIVVEVDIKADVAELENKESGYLFAKAQKMLDFGVEKIIWVLTDQRKTYVIDRNDPTWYVVNWSETLTLLDGATLNIEQMLNDEEIDY